MGLPGKVTLLRQSEFFRRLLSDDLFWLAAQAGVYRFSGDEVAFRIGERAERFFIVKSGAVAVTRPVDGGEIREMARFEEGDVVGDFDFARSAEFDAQAQAVGPSTLLVFPDFGRTMGLLASERPDVIARILLRSVAMISSRVRSTQMLISENAPWVRELRRQMYTDPSTGLWARAFLDDELPRLVSAPTAIILIKPDRFKDLCDRFGHGAGDVAMERIAGVLNIEARRQRRAWALRLRSNETAFVAAGCGFEEALKIVTRLSRAVGDIDLSDVSCPGGFRIGISASMAVWPEDGADFKVLVEHAYGVLMRAWRDGGTRVYRVRPHGPDHVACSIDGAVFGLEETSRNPGDGSGPITKTGAGS